MVKLYRGNLVFLWRVSSACSAVKPARSFMFLFPLGRSIPKQLARRRMYTHTRIYVALLPLSAAKLDSDIYIYILYTAASACCDSSPRGISCWEQPTMWQLRQKIILWGGEVAGKTSIVTAALYLSSTPSYYPAPVRFFGLLLLSSSSIRTVVCNTSTNDRPTDRLTFISWRSRHNDWNQHAILAVLARLASMAISKSLALS